MTLHCALAQSMCFLLVIDDAYCKSPSYRPVELKPFRTRRARTACAALSDAIFPKWPALLDTLALHADAKALMREEDGRK
jgi:hypothetical protein